MNIINISCFDSYYLNKDKREWVINNTKTYATDKYKLRIVRHKPNNLRHEIEIIRKADLLKKKLTTYFNGINKLRQYKTNNQKDDTIIKQRHLKKHKKTIINYINYLRQDNNFAIKRQGNQLNIIYNGQYAKCLRAVALLWLHLRTQN